MSASYSWHPVDGAYHAEANQREGAVWVTVTQGAGGNSQTATFFFPTVSQARLVAAAFNDGPEPQTNGDEKDGPDN